MKQEKESGELYRLLTNIRDGLKTYNLKELNDALLGVLNKKGRKEKEIFFIIDQVCVVYNITRRVLFYSGEREVCEARKLSYVLLHDCIYLSQIYISKYIFKKNRSLVNTAIKYFRTIDTKIKKDREFKEKYDGVNKKYVDFINEEKLKGII